MLQVSEAQTHVSTHLVERPRPPRSPLVPYTTLFRSHLAASRTHATSHRPVRRRRRQRTGIPPRPLQPHPTASRGRPQLGAVVEGDRKSTRLHSSHVSTSYAVFCLKKNIAFFVRQPAR